MTHIITAMAQALAGRGAETAYIDQDMSMSRRDAMAVGMAVAERLQSEDLGLYRHVGILLPSGFGIVGSIFGCWLADAVAAPMNPLLSHHEIAEAAQAGDIKVILSGGLLLRKARAAGLHAVDIGEIYPTPDAAERLPARMQELAERDATNDAAVILFTAGTTGSNKAALLTHGNILFEVKALHKRYGCKSGDSILAALPAFQSFGLITCLLMPSLEGMTVVFLRDFSPSAAVAAIQGGGVQYAPLVPSMYAELLKHVMNTRADLGGVRAFISGGAALPSLLMHAWQRVIGKPIHQGYGLTEASSTVAVGPFDDFRHGTAGKPLEGVEVQIWTDKGKPVPNNQIGEVVVRGPNVMRGYHRAGEANVATITHDGWLKTGDYGTISHEGYLTITGRKKDVIIVGGENVHPQEVEKVIAGVEGVGEAAVVAGLGDMSGEFVRACVAPIPANEAALREAITARCRSKLAPFKVPQKIDFYEQLPRNVLGKVMKDELAATPSKH